jgi:hypothetical protein
LARQDKERDRQEREAVEARRHALRHGRERGQALHRDEHRRHRRETEAKGNRHADGKQRDEDEQQDQYRQPVNHTNFASSVGVG